LSPRKPNSREKKIEKTLFFVSKKKMSAVVLKAEQERKKNEQLQAIAL
jgi:hypothetical protein